MGEIIKSIKNSSLNKTWLLVSVLVILTIVLLVLSLNSKNVTRTSTETENIETDFRHTALSISEEVRRSSPSGTYEVDINIDTKNNEVTGVQLELTFDPKILTRVDIKEGEFIIDPTILIKDINTESGRITFALVNKPGQKAVKGEGVVAVFSFSKISPAETEINFLPHTAVSAPGINQSVLKETVSAVVGPLPTPTAGVQTQIFLSPTPIPTL
ncbi:MAG: hypothetical protein HYW63_04200 [Candidatus Levybacteria bacterium]|nr:hypothetical protein [Candidatus Levybacteria bacterium]